LPESLIVSAMRRKRIWLIAAVLTILLLLASGVAVAQGSRATTANKAKKAPSSGKKAAAKSPQTAAGKAKGRTSTSRRRRRAVYRGPTAPTPQRIREIQQALNRSGHYRREATGKMDANTVAALSSFQEAHGLQRTGKLNAWTLRKLEQFGLPPSSRASTGEAGAEKANP